MSTPRLEIRSMRKAWAGRAVLSDLSLSLDAGEHALIQGASGAGKSTLLGVIARLIPPDAGEVLLDGAAVQTLGSPSRFRRERLGLVFQDPLLVDSLTAFANLEMASLHQEGSGPAPRTLLDRLGLQVHARTRAGLLSRGERQRLALARAFVGRPRLILADEPTASLDPGAKAAVLDQLFALAADAGATLLVVSHDPSVAQRTDFQRTVRLQDGQLLENTLAANSGPEIDPAGPLLRTVDLGADDGSPSEADMKTPSLLPP